MMGLTDLPYHTCQAVTWEKCTDMGDHFNSTNLFAWDNVLNLPCTYGYDCHIPWVFKKRSDGLLAAYLCIYVDYGRPIGPTEDLCW